MQWENDIWCTLRDTAKQSETRWIYDVIQTDQSTWSWENTSWFELVKVISHQSVIIWWFNSTTEFVRIRLRSKGVHCGSSPEKRQGHLPHHACKVERQLHHRSNDDIAGSTQTTVINKSSYYILSTGIHLTSFERWTEFQKQWTEYAHTNGHRHSLIPCLHHRSDSPILRKIDD